MLLRRRLKRGRLKSFNAYLTLLLTVALLSVNTGCKKDSVPFMKLPAAPKSEAAKLEITENTDLDFGKVSLNYPDRRYFTLTNHGKYHAKISPSVSDKSFNFLGGSWPGDGGNCPQVLYMGESCRFVVAFKPSDVKKYNDRINLDYDSGFSAQSLSVQMKGQGVDTPFLYFEHYDATIEFGDYLVNGDSGTKTLVVKYAGGADKFATSISRLLLGPSYSYVGGSCGETLGANPGQCTLQVQFNPFAAGVINQKLVLEYSNGSSPEKVSTDLTGNGSNQKTAGKISISGSVTNFTKNGRIYPGQTISASFTVSHSGGTQNVSDLNVLSFLNPNVFNVTANNCPATLEKNAACTIIVMFTAPAFINNNVNANTYNDSIKINYNNGLGGMGTASWNIKGSVGTEAILQFSNANLHDFGNVSKVYSAEHDWDDRRVYIKISNHQVAVPPKVTAWNLDSSKANFFTMNQNTCSTNTVGVNSSGKVNEDVCRLDVRFNPYEVSSMAFTGKLEVSYNTNKPFSGPDINITKDFQGIGIAQAYLRLTNNAYFGNVFQGNSVNRTTRVRYFGTETAKLQSFTAFNNSQFSFGINGCPDLSSGSFALADDNCEIEFIFTPIVGGPYNVIQQNGMHLTFTSGTDTTSINSNNMRLRGTKLRPAVIVGNATFDVGNIQKGDSNNCRSFSIRNNHNDPVTIATLESVTISGASYSSCGGSCVVGKKLDDYQTCSISLRLAANVTGTFSGSVEVKYHDGEVSGQTFTASLKGVVIASPKLEVNVSGQFSDMPINNIATETVTLTIANSGNASSSNININLSQVTTGEIVVANNGNGCSGVTALAVGASCAIELKFTPLYPGEISKTITFSSGLWTQSIDVSGKGLVDPILAAGGNHSCAADKYAKVKCWGRNLNGQRGTNADLTFNRDDYVTQLALGDKHTCVRTLQGNVRCWGANSNGDINMGGAKVKDITAGFAHTCAIMEGRSGELRCWGLNDKGQLGNGTIDNSNTPVVASEMESAVLQVSLGTGHSCALVAGGEVICFGDNFYGQLGVVDSNFPLAINLGTGLNAESISIGGGFSCALLDNATVKCWGQNEKGMLGTCWAPKAGGFSACWDSTENPLLGYGDGAVNQMGNYLSPVDLGSSFSAGKMASGDSFSCVVASNNQDVKCFGEINNHGDEAGEMGDSLPFSLTGKAIKTISAGAGHVCVLYSDNTITCWGKNGDGQAPPNVNL